MPKNQAISNFFKPKNDKNATSQTVRSIDKSKIPKATQSPEKSKKAEPLTPKIEKLTSNLENQKIESESSSLEKNSSDKENVGTSVKALKRPKASLELTPKIKRSRKVIESDSDDGDDQAINQKSDSPKRLKSSPKLSMKSDSKKAKIEKEEKLSIDSIDQDFKPISLENYDPSSSNFNYKKDICWKPNSEIPYAALAKTLNLIGSTTKRLIKTEILSNHLKAVLHHNNQKELAVCLQFCVNSVAPEFKGIELGLGPQILCKAIAESTGSKPNTVKENAQSKCKGDLGDYAELCKTKQKQSFMKPKLMSCIHVFKKLQQIANTSGKDSVNRKAGIIREVLVNCSKPYEALFLIRSLGGKLRIQLQHATLLQALGEAAFSHFKKNLKKGHNYTAKDAENSIKTAYVQLPDLELLANTLYEDGWQNLSDKIHLTPGIPTKPMLAHPTKGIREVLDRFKDAGDFTCEWKYDGERAQIHVNDKKEITIYSRNQENHTEKYPDIIERMLEILKHPDCTVKSCMLDSEAVAYDVKNDQLLPFQILTTRKKKGVNIDDIKVQVCVYAFDLLYLNGEPLIKKSFNERRTLLRSVFPTIPGKFVYAQGKDCSDPNDIQDELDASIKGGCEGLMVKTLDTNATYEIADRSRNWLKLKKDYLDGVGDTLDLVPIGAWRGKGKRGDTFGAYLLACYDEDDGEYQAICKVGTGFKDTDLSEIHTRCKNYIIDAPKPYYQFSEQQKDIKDIVWFDCMEVWEIKCADLTLSPVYKASFGNAQNGKGISLRFPRFERLREDKKVDQATTSGQVLDMYFNQDQMKM